MKQEYIITRLRLVSDTKPNAEIELKRGLNVIYGPTNTGKSYIYECLNYMLGSSQPPKNISEARDYNYILLEIMLSNNEYYTLKRDMKGGNCLCYKSSLDNINQATKYEKLSKKHSDKNENNISAFFLCLNKIKGKKIIKNKYGGSRGLSYRDIVRYIMINETIITTDQSLILSQNKPSNTAEKSALEFIVTGNDASIISDLSKDKISNMKGRIEAIERLIEELGDTGVLNQEELVTQIDKVDSSISSISSEYILLSNEYSLLFSQRNDMENQLLTLNAQLKTNHELLFRSSILKAQYKSDRSRLEATIEACNMLPVETAQMSICPLCNSLISNKIEIEDVDMTIESCNSEIRKIEILQIEQSESNDLICAECKALDNRVINTSAKLDELIRLIENEYITKIQEYSNNITELNNKKSSLQKQLFIIEQIKKFEDIKAGYFNQIPTAQTTAVISGLTTANMEVVSQSIKAILEDCKYPNITNVSYSEGKSDFVISGEDRNLDGKGLRAITYLSFILSLQKVLLDKDYSIGVP